MHAILEEGSPCGDRVVVLGGERIGLVAAEYLASRGKQVTIVEVGKRLGEDVIATFKWRHAARVRELQIHTLVNAQAKEITAAGVRVEEKDGSERLVQARSGEDNKPLPLRTCAVIGCSLFDKSQDERETT